MQEVLYFLTLSLSISRELRHHRVVSTSEDSLQHTSKDIFTMTFLFLNNNFCGIFSIIEYSLRLSWNM